MIKNKKGNSIIEIVIGTTIVTITSLAVFNLFITNKKITQKVSRSSACQNQVNTIISKFASMGTRVLVHDPADDAMYTGGGDVPAGDHTEPGVNSADRWPNDTPNYQQWTLPTNATDPLTIRTANLIRGSHSAVAAIYNSSVTSGASDFCTGYQDYNFNDGDDTILPAGNFNGMTNVQSQLRIEPYNIITKATITPCTTVPPPVLLVPLATSGDVDPAVAIQGANVRSDIGFLVSIRTSYDTTTGNTVTCTGQVRFEYPTDDAAPANADSAGPTAWDPNFSQPFAETNYAYEEEWEWPTGSEDIPTRIATNPPDVNDNSLQIQIGYTGDNLEQGSLVVCRDRSTLDDATNYNLPCFDSSDTEATWMPQCDPTLNCGDSPQAPTTDLHDTSLGWVDCDDVQVCGVDPDTPGTWGAPPNDKLLTLNYSNLPLRCNVFLEMMAVDVSGNRRITNYYTKIPSPSCGYFCDAAWDPVSYAAAGFPNGYFHEDTSCPDQLGGGPSVWSAGNGENCGDIFGRPCNPGDQSCWDSSVPGPIAGDPTGLPCDGVTPGPLCVQYVDASSFLLHSCGGAGAATLTIDPNPDSFAFGGVDLGLSRSQTFTVTNSGTIAATGVTGLALGGDFSWRNSASYPGVGGTCGATIPAGANCTIRVRYAPSNLGPSNATVTLNYSGGVSPTATAAISGSGQQFSGITPCFGEVFNPPGPTGDAVANCVSTCSAYAGICGGSYNIDCSIPAQISVGPPDLWSSSGSYTCP